jgi:MFS family permease
MADRRSSVEDLAEGANVQEVDLTNKEVESGVQDDEPEPDHPLLKEEGSDRVRLPPALYLVYLSVFIDAFGGLMAIPVLPQIVLKATEQGENFGLDAGLGLGILSACYQFFSVPSLMITTSLADIHGRRPFFMVGFAGSAIGFLVMAFYSSVNPMLLSPIIGRSIGGIFSASPPLAHGYISDIVGTKSKESGVYRSYLGSIFMFALIFAPGFGGGLSELGLGIPFFVSTGLAVIGLLLSYVYLKESMVDPKPICDSICGGVRKSASAPKETELAPSKGEKKEKRTSEVAREEMHHMEKHIIMILFVMGALLNFGFRIFIMMGALFVFKKFGWGAAMFGFSASILGCFGIFLNVKMYPHALKKFGKHGCCVIGAFISAVGYIIIWAARKTEEDEDPRSSGVVMKGAFVHMLGMFVMQFGNILTQSSLSSLVARYAAKNQQAGIQGKYRAMQAVTGFVAPLIGGIIFDSENWNMLPIISSAVLFTFAFLGRVVIKLNHDLHLVDPIEHDTYPHHSWCEIIPGVTNPLTMLHANHHAFTLTHTAHESATVSH